MDCLDTQRPLTFCKRGLLFLKKIFKHISKIWRKGIYFAEKKIQTMLKGKQAPDFSLFSSDKAKVNLSDFIGKENILILFFPQAFTGICTNELCSVRDNISLYQNLNAQVIGISVDSVFTLAKFKELEKLNFPMLSDFNKEVSSLYGSIYESFTDMGMKGVSKRSAFVIDKQGVIQYEEVLESAGDVPNFEAINEILKSLQ